MFHHVLTSCRRLLMGVVWLFFFAFSLEVGLRIQSARHGLPPLGQISTGRSRVASTPSATTFTQASALQMAQSRAPQLTGAGWKWNSWGLRGKEPVVPKPGGVFRLVWLGGDSVLQPDVEESQMRSSCLQTELKDGVRETVEVINAGQPDGSAMTNLLWWKHHGVGLQPDVVMISLTDRGAERDVLLRKHVLNDPSGRSAGCPHPSLLVAGGSTELANWRRELRTIDLLFQGLGETWKSRTGESSRGDGFGGVPNSSTAGTTTELKKLDVTTVATLELAELCRSWGRTLAVIIEAGTDTKQATLWNHRRLVMERAGIRCCLIEGRPADRERVNVLASFLRNEVIGPWNASQSTSPRVRTESVPGRPAVFRSDEPGR